MRFPVHTIDNGKARPRAWGSRTKKEDGFAGTLTGADWKPAREDKSAKEGSSGQDRRNYRRKRDEGCATASCLRQTQEIRGI